MIVPTLDMEYIKMVITHPKVWPWVSDAGSGSPDDFAPSKDMSYLKPVENGVDFGLFCVKGVNTTTCEIHTALLPESRGKSRVFASEVLDFIGSEMGMIKVITMVPENNVKAKSLAEDSGFEVEGYISKSWLSSSGLVGQYLMGVSLCP